MTSIDLRDAIRFAHDAHRGQTDWSGQPFIGHPLRVMAYLLDDEIVTDITTVAAAVLHDVVEDTYYTSEDVAYHFGADVGELLDAVSRRSDETYFDYIMRLCEGPDGALAIKLADLRDNMDERRVLADTERYTRLQVRYAKARRIIRQELISRDLYVCEECGGMGRYTSGSGETEVCGECGGMEA